MYADIMPLSNDTAMAAAQASVVDYNARAAGGAEPCFDTEGLSKACSLQPVPAIAEGVCSCLFASQPKLPSFCICMGIVRARWLTTMACCRRDTLPRQLYQLYTRQLHHRRMTTDMGESRSAFRHFVHRAFIKFDNLFFFLGSLPQAFDSTLWTCPPRLTPPMSGITTLVRQSKRSPSLHQQQ